MPTACKSQDLRLFKSPESLVSWYDISGCGSQLTTIHSWFILGQLFASVALYFLNASDPYNYKIPIYTQVRYMAGPTPDSTR